MQRNILRTVMSSFVAALLISLTNAQTVEKRTLSIEGAKTVIAAAVAEARRLKSPGGVIAVVDDGGNLMALERLDGTFAAGAKISIGKARTAALFKRPTKAFEEIIKNGRTAMVALPDDLFTPLQGGVPILIGDQIVGAIGVSGAASAQQDEELAIAGANALSPENKASAKPITFFDHKDVSAAFQKGSVLFDQGERYMVHASHRDKAGVAELHELDADIIYMLEGSATLVTGGSVVEPKTIAPSEIRGTEIKDGQSRTITKGDVIIVPAGTPHWFKEISGPISYYVVKVR
ncbi:MAG TPA: heme-binding protein [Blastocatellia bacterium]|nr:heme-binding protein [Blastocatellia bacterium]